MNILSFQNNLPKLEIKKKKITMFLHIFQKNNEDIKGLKKLSTFIVGL